MNEVQIEIFPTGQTVSVPKGTPLKDTLFQLGVEFPCGGKGICGKCRIKVLRGYLPPSAADLALIHERDIEAGWRLACQAKALEPITIELDQWTFQFLVDHSPIVLKSLHGLGIAVDVGTTTLVVQTLDLRSGSVLTTKTALNAQAQFGHDVISRIDFAKRFGTNQLTRIIRQQIGSLIADSLAELLQNRPHGLEPVSRVVLVGNTAMHHFFCGLPIDTLAELPFEPVDPSMKTFTPNELGWTDGLPIQVTSLLNEETRVDFLPCIGGFVGSDILAGILATGIHTQTQYHALIDLGTNGEIVIGRHDRIICTSTAAGPAFEGAGISCGMRASTGAIAAISLENGNLRLTVIGGNTKIRGICGSGLLDALAVGLRLGIIAPSGRLINRQKWSIAPNVELTQADIRQIQLAKGAIAAGFKILLRTLGIGPTQLAGVFLAGAFGNYIDPQSALQTGLLPIPPTTKITQAGNTALVGAKIALFTSPEQISILAKKVEHLPLNTQPEFQEIFAEQMMLGPQQDT